MTEKPIWEIVAQRFSMLKKMQGVDGYNLVADLTAEVLKGLDQEQIKPILMAHGLNANKFF